MYTPFLFFCCVIVQNGLKIMCSFMQHKQNCEQLAVVIEKWSRNISIDKLLSVN